MGADFGKAKDKALNSLSSAKTTGKKFVDRARPRVEKAAGASIEIAKDIADKTTDSVARGVHKVMGSSEYRAKADEVNRQLERALQSLEDSIVRRDREIDRLRARIAELESLLTKH